MSKKAFDNDRRIAQQHALPTRWADFLYKTFTIVDAPEKRIPEQKVRAKPWGRQAQTRRNHSKIRSKSPLVIERSTRLNTKGGPFISWSG